jgi:hypothetical protein
MSIAKHSHPRDKAFEQVLDRIDPAFRPAIEVPRGESAGIHFWAEPASGQNPGPDAVAAFYAEFEPPPAPEPAATPNETPDLATQAAHLRGEIRADLGVHALRQLRRRCAFIAHPDRALHFDRKQAEQLMAEINAAIDQAIRNRTARSPEG